MQTCLMRVLVADDDDFFRMALGALLRQAFANAQVSEARSLEEALELIGRSPPFDLAVIDLDMPGMDGASSLATVRKAAPDVRLVMASASESRRVILDALEAGAHGYIPKREGVAVMISAINAVVAGSIFVPRQIAAVDGHAVSSEKPGLNLPKLTYRQREVLALLVQGRSNKEICRILNLSDGTVKVHISAVLKALQVKNRSAAAAIGARLLP